MRILVAEDDDFLRELLCDFLSEMGHEVCGAASDGLELLKLAMCHPPDLIVTDLQMPGMSGDSMIAMLDADPCLCGIPVIAISGLPPAIVRQLGIAAEIPVLPKPFNFAQVALEIRRLSGGKWDRRAGKGELS